MSKSKLPEVCEEVSKRLFVIVQVGRGDEETLDDDPRLLPVVGVRAARLESVQGFVDGLLRRQTHGGLTVLEVDENGRPARLTLVVVQLKHTIHYDTTLDSIFL